MKWLLGFCLLFIAGYGWWRAERSLPQNPYQNSEYQKISAQQKKKLLDEVGQKFKEQKLAEIQITPTSEADDLAETADMIFHGSVEVSSEEESAITASQEADPWASYAEAREVDESLWSNEEVEFVENLRKPASVKGGL